MFTLQDLLGQEQGGTALNEISQNVGADQSAVNSAIQAALPMILGGLANNAQSPQGAQGLDQALERDHDGSILNQLGGLGGLIFGQQQAAPPKQADAGGILGHIFGTNQAPVVQEVSQKSGLDMGQVAQVLMFLAPIVMGYLGKQKREQGVGADGLGGLLGGLLGQSAAAGQGSGNPMMDAASSMLDRNRDGSSMDDIASMAMDYFRRK